MGLRRLLGAFAIALTAWGGAVQAADTLVQNLPAASPVLPTLSCLYAAEWSGAVYLDRSVCGSYATAFGAVPLNGAGGTPTALNLTNATHLPIGTGVDGLAANIATFLGAPSSVNFFNALTSKTGTGNAVFSISPVLTTPNLGTPTVAVLTNATGLPLPTGVSGLLPVGNGGLAHATYNNGELPIGNTLTGGLDINTLIAGANVTITNTPGHITIASTGGGSATPGGVNGDIEINSSSTFGGLTPGAGVTSFLSSPAGNVLASWLASGAAVTNLGFTPPPNTRAINTSGLLVGGGNLTADRTITMATIAPNTLFGNPTGSTAAPTTITLGTNLNFSGGVLNATGGTGSLASGATGALQISLDGSGAFGNIVPGTGVAAFLATPVAGIPATWLQAGAAVANLGFTPASNARTVTAGTGLSGGGDLTANRTFSVNATQIITGITNLTSNGLVKTAGGVGTLGIATPGTDYAAATTGAANLPLFTSGAGGFTNGTRSGNTTRVVTMDASNPATGDCPQYDANDNLTTSGAPCGGSSALTVTDSTNPPVTSTSSIAFDPKVYVVSGSAGAAIVSSTNTVGTDRSAGDYTIDTTDNNTVLPVGSGHTYTVAQAGTTGFANGWGACLQNISTSGNATVNTTTSLFQGAGGGTSFLLPAQAWACPASKSGNWVTQLGYGTALYPSRTVYADATTNLLATDSYVSLGAATWTVPATYRLPSIASVPDGKIVEIADDLNKLSGQTLTIAVATGSGNSLLGTTQLNSGLTRAYCRAAGPSTTWTCWPSMANSSAAGQILVGQGSATTPAWVALGGDVTSVDAFGVLTLGKIHGITVPSAYPPHSIPYANTSTDLTTSIAAVNNAIVNTSGSGIPSETVTPVLGAAASVSGTLGLANGAGGGAIATISSGATTAWEFKLPTTAGTAGQVLTSGGGGGAANTWGTGSGSGTVNSGTANQLAYYGTTGAAVSGNSHTTDDGSIFTVDHAVALSGSIAPTALSGDATDYNPAGLSTASTILIDGGAADRFINSLAGGVDGRVVTIVNIGTTNNLKILSDDGATGTAAMRFALSLSSRTLLPNGAITLRYSTSGSSRWRPMVSYAPTYVMVSGAATMSVSATTYYAFGSFAGSTTEPLMEMPIGGTVKNLRAIARADIGNTQTAVITVRKNNVDQGLTCTITGNGSTGTKCNAASDVIFALGDVMTMKVVSSGVIASNPFQVSYLIQ